MSILRGMASVLAGVGTGLVSNKEAAEKKARQDKVDAWLQEQQGRQRGEWAKADRLEADVAEAGKPMAAATGLQVTDAAGSNAFTKDADAAAMMVEMAQAKNGQAASAAATRVGDRSYTDKEQADKALTDANSEQGVTQRLSQAFRDNGKPLEAIQMQSAAMGLKAKQLGLSVAEMDFADKTTRKLMGEALASGKSWHEGAAKFITESQYPGVKDLKAESVVSPDGKSVTLFTVKPDGTREARGTFPAGEEGSMAFMEKFGSIPIEARMSLMHGRSKAAQDQANSDREYELRKKDQLFNQTHKRELLSMRGASGVGGGDTQDQAKSVSLKDRRDMLGDFGKMLPDAGGAFINPNEAAAMQVANARKLESADAMFSMNAQFGTILTAPQIARAMELAGDSSNVRTIRDEQTGALYRTVVVGGKPVVVGGKPVVVGGKPVVVGIAQQKPTEAPAAQTAPSPAAPKTQMRDKTVAASAQPEQKPRSLVQALAGPSTTSAPLMEAAQQKAQAIQALADNLKQAQAGVVVAAKSQNPEAVQAAMQQVQAGRAKLNQAVAGMSPQQAKQVLAAAGVQ